MKNTIITLAIGILIGRHIYMRYDKQEALKKEARIKRHLMEVLEDLGLSAREASTQSNAIIKK